MKFPIGVKNSIAAFDIPCHTVERKVVIVSHVVLHHSLNMVSFSEIPEIMLSKTVAIVDLTVSHADETVSLIVSNAPETVDFIVSQLS